MREEFDANVHVLPELDRPSREVVEMPNGDAMTQ
jgi:hypothetical protein